VEVAACAVVERGSGIGWVHEAFGGGGGFGEHDAVDGCWALQGGRGDLGEAAFEFVFVRVAFCEFGFPSRDVCKGVVESEPPV
jgi:hypothetical protein